MAKPSLVRPWWSSAQTTTRGSLSQHRQVGADGVSELTWVDGHVATPHGYVIVYADGGPKRIVHMQFIWRGRQHGGRCEGRVFSRRDLAREARRFAEDIVRTAR